METTAKRGVHPLIIAISAVLALGIAASCTLSALALRSVSAQEEAVTELRDTFNGLVSGGEEAVTQEDDVAVGGDYWIRSTLPISDAYKSGDASALSEKQAETLEMASEVLGGIITEGMTVYEKEKAVYDWMCSNIHHEGGITVVVPTASEYSAEPYGVLKYRQAVCVGFATTFRMFMQMLDIECKVVHNSYHSWDLVRLDDGEWYHVDIYSDAGRGDYANFNMNDELASGGARLGPRFLPRGRGARVLLLLSERRAARGHLRPAAVRPRGARRRREPEPLLPHPELRRPGPVRRGRNALAPLGRRERLRHGPGPRPLHRL